MAPRARRGEAAEPQAFHELGVRGRKTGVFLPDGGERDEHGMQPLDAVFSSPSKAAASTNGAAQSDSGSEDMDIASSAGPGPRTLLKSQHSYQYPIPRSRSPLKTNLKSPARKNPLVGRLSSPTQPSVGAEHRDVTVTRRLNFAGRPDASRIGSARGVARGVNGTGGDDEDGLDQDIENMVEQSLQMVDDMGDDYGDYDDGAGDEGEADVGVALDEEEEEQEEEEEDQEQEEPPVRQRRRRPTRQQGQSESSPASRPGRKRPSPRTSKGGDDHVEEAPQDEEEDEEPRQTKRPRTRGPAATKAIPPARTATGKAKAAKAKAPVEPTSDDKAKPKGRRGRKAKEPDAELDAGEASFMALQRGPPMPKARGLVSVRRDADSMTQTRSGRHSYKPVQYWRGEQVIRQDEEQSDMFHKGDFVLPSVKEIVRIPPDAPPSKRAPRSRGRAGARAGSRSLAAAGDDEELEAWELSPGTVTGEIVLWEPEHEEHPPADDEPVQVADDRIAISADAIQTSDIKDASFRFAKTLTMPFMGAGVVDLPPGSEKRPKNSRRMHMVFFVHYGKVLVTINEAQFRISAGGTWFVPRGNYYSIANDYDNPSRIFFAQACEVPAPQPVVGSPDQSAVALAY